MFHLRLLPWEYGIRNLLRRPSRSALTLAALTIVVLLIFVVVGFIRGLERSLAVSGDPDVVLVYSLGAEENIENSAIAARTPGLLAASLEGVKQRFGVAHASAELYLGTRIAAGDKQGALGLVRGVTTTAAPRPPTGEDRRRTLARRRRDSRRPAGCGEVGRRSAAPGAWQASQV